MDDQFQLEVINEDGDILSHTSKKEVHEKHLLHKSANVLIVDSIGRIYSVFKSPHKTDNPGWTTSVGTHVRLKESYDQAAKRELKDVLSLHCPLVLMDKVRIVTDTENEISAIYLGYANEVTLNSKLEETGKFFTLEDLKELQKTNQTTPHLNKALELYLKNN